MTQTVVNLASLRASPKTMRAAVLRAPRTIEIVEVPIPQPGPGQVRIRLEGCGVCASSVPPWEGRDWLKYPWEPGQPGHEGWGYIDALGPNVQGLHVGDRVTMLSSHAYAQYDLAPADQVVCLPNTLTGQPFPGEAIGSAINVMRRCEIHGCHRVAIIGIGFLGAILTRLATNAGACVIAISRRPFALEIGRMMGASCTIPMGDQWRIVEEIKAMTDGRMCEVVIEAVGKQWPLDLAGELTGERGRLVIAGYHQDGLRQCNLQLWNWRGLDVINAHERDPRAHLCGVHAAVEMVASKKLDPRPLYTHTFPLDRLADALAMTQDRPNGFMKALITM
ncbi:MAG TPA: zinc-binding dehydrogenase [Tepidisphaeraceae bacterium]|nr:zinc-binding dehydrogenase [Tepidisphaeraceae bacterium]